MRQLKNVFAILTLFFTALFIACSDGNNSNGNGDEASGDTVVCTYYMKDDTSVYYVFYGDKTAEYHAKGKIANTRSELIYSGNPLKAGTVSLKISLTGTELISFNVKESNGTLIPTVELVPGFPVEYTLTLDGKNDNEENSGTDKKNTEGSGENGNGENGGTETPEEPSTDIDESPLMFMGFDNVVTIEKGTDITGITNTIYSLTSDTTLKFKGGINSITLTTIAAAMGTNDSVKIALDFSEATGITEWTNKLAGLKTLYAISLPGTVTSVQDNAFANCTNLKAITVPCSITAYPSTPSSTIVNFVGTLEDWLKSSVVLPDSKFYYDSTAGKYVDYSPKLYLNGKIVSGITIPDSVTSIRKNAFKNCSAITKVRIPDSVTSIGDYAFHNCRGLMEVSLGNSVAYIGDYAFSSYPENDKGWRSVSIPDSVSYIGKNAFSIPRGSLYISFGENTAERGEGWCAVACNIDISGSSIPSNAFLNCNEITSISINENVTSIGSRAFYGCSGLKVLTIWEGDTPLKLENNVFSGSPLESINLRRDIEFEDEPPFAAMTTLKQVYIACNVTNIADGAFSGCTKLESVAILGNVESIGQKAFFDCENLYKLTLSSKLATIGSYAFAVCQNLEYVRWDTQESPEPLTIGDYAFAYCYSLQDRFLLNNATLIGNHAFEECGLVNINIPVSVTSIGESAFHNCSDLWLVKYAGTESQWQKINIANDAFSGTASHSHFEIWYNSLND